MIACIFLLKNAVADKAAGKGAGWDVVVVSFYRGSTVKFMCI